MALSATVYEHKLRSHPKWYGRVLEPGFRTLEMSERFD